MESSVMTAIPRQLIHVYPPARRRFVAMAFSDLMEVMRSVTRARKTQTKKMRRVAQTVRFEGVVTPSWIPVSNVIQVLQEA